MMPGVTYLPAPSMTIASAGALTAAPTAAIFPFWSRIAPFRIIGPAAVRMLTLRITVGREGNGVYVLGNGSAFGVDVAPSPAPVCAVSRAGVDEVRVCGVALAHAVAPASRKQYETRIWKTFLRRWILGRNKVAQLPAECGELRD